LIEDRRVGITQQHRYLKLYSIKQDHYWERNISDRDRNPKKLWKKLALLTRQKKVRQELSKDLDAGIFMKAFLNKVEGVRKSTPAAEPPSFEDTDVSQASTNFKRLIYSTSVNSSQQLPTNNTSSTFLQPGWS
jgi:hypothetical protein